MTSTRHRPARPALALTSTVVAVVLLAGCSGGADPAAGPTRSASPSPSPSASANAPEEPTVYVAVGASDTVGVGADDPQREAWPQILHDSALPAATVVNVGVSGATVRGALEGQLPSALAADPDVVTVWLAVNDIVSLVPVAAYERQLQTLVHALRRDGSTEVLVGNAPDLWRLPAYRACVPGSGVTDVACLLPYLPSVSAVRTTVAQFNAAIERVVQAEGAQLVDLSAHGELTGLTAGDGFHPSTAGHREVAAAFARVLGD